MNDYIELPIEDNVRIQNNKINEIVRVVNDLNLSISTLNNELNQIKLKVENME